MFDQKEEKMQSALYYPFTGPEGEAFLKTALFLWDSVDFIVPYDGFRLHGRTEQEDEAMEIVGRSYVPTEKDKRNAHDELRNICKGPLPSKLVFELQKPDLAYDFYPEKLLHETWEMLSQSRLARIVNNPRGISSVSTGPLFGYYMMSILAVCCSQGRKRLVTDQIDPYRTLANILVDSSPHPAESHDWHGKLITLTLKGPDFGSISLRSLIDLRRHEDKLLLDLRRTFLETVDKTTADICSNADNPNIVTELVKAFTDTLEKDLKELKRALRRSAASVLLSKEFGFSVLAATASVALEPISGTLLTVGGLSKGLLDYQDRRHKILREHPSSWLIAAGGPRIPVF
jgi:hypothetical protein